MLHNIKVIPKVALSVGIPSTSELVNIIIIIIDKSLGIVGRLLLQGHSRRPK